MNRIVKQTRRDLRMIALRQQDKSDRDLVLFMIGGAALLILLGTILMLYGGYYLAPNPS